MRSSFFEYFENFLSLMNKTRLDYYRANFPNVPCSDLMFKTGRRYIKIVDETSVVAFIDKQTGDIFKPASWKSPAKHARGNIFSEQGGQEAMTMAGRIRYLKGENNE